MLNFAAKINKSWEFYQVYLERNRQKIMYRKPEAWKIS